jgi:hypothetical protein
VAASRRVDVEPDLPPVGEATADDERGRPVRGLPDGLVAPRMRALGDDGICRRPAKAPQVEAARRSGRRRRRDEHDVERAGRRSEPCRQRRQEWRAVRRAQVPRCEPRIHPRLVEIGAEDVVAGEAQQRRGDASRTRDHLDEAIDWRCLPPGRCAQDRCDVARRHGGTGHSGRVLTGRSGALITSARTPDGEG